MYTVGHKTVTCPDPFASAALPGDCSFHQDCLETIYNCGPTGYPVGYGDKYCKRFFNRIDQFSPAGQEWINGTLVCLKETLLDFVVADVDLDTNGNITCNGIRETAFYSHAPCYVDNGFCDLAFDYGHPAQFGRVRVGSYRYL